MRRAPTASALAVCLTAAASITVLSAGPATPAIAGILTPPPPPAQLLANRGFEAARFTGELSAWSCGPGTGLARPGYRGSAFALTGKPTATSLAECSQTVPVRPNSTYQIHAIVRGGPVVIGTDSGTLTVPRTTTWTPVATQVVADFTTTTVRVLVRGAPGGGRFTIDDVQIVGWDSTVLTPAVPTVLVAGEQTSKSVQLSWVGTPGSSQYRVYLDGTVVAYGWGGLETTKVDGLLPGTTYEFTVTAVNSAGETQHSPPVTATTAPKSAEVPRAVGRVTAASVPEGVRLRWKAVPGATDGYNVFLDGSQTTWVFGTEVVVELPRGEGRGRVYTFQVSALNFAGEGAKSRKVRIRH